MVMRLRCLICFCAIVVATGCQDRPAQGVGDPPELGDWTLVQTARIGSLNDPEQTLTRVSAVRMGPRGRLFVAQPMENIIRVYDQTGTLINTIGGRGEGPGEFSGLWSIGFMGDTLYASDNRLGRVSLFNLEGELLTSVRWTTEQARVPAGILMPTAPQVLLDDGGGLVQPGSAIPVGPDGAPSGELEVPFLRIDPTGHATDTLGRERMRFTSATVMVDGTEVVFRSPFDELPRAELMPDGSGLVVVDGVDGADPAHFRVTLVDPRGDTAWSRQVAYDPLPMVDGAVWEAVEELHAVLERRPPPHPTTGQIERALRTAGMIPDTFVPVSDVAGGQDGSIWVRRENRPEDRIRWDVFTPEGEREARVDLPKGARVVTSVDHAVVTLEPDELDVPYLVWYETRR